MEQRGDQGPDVLEELFPDENDRLLLQALVATIVPEDGHPSAVQTGGLTFLHRVLTRDHPEWRPRIDAVLRRVRDLSVHGEKTFVDLAQPGRLGLLDQLNDDLDYRWLADLVNDGFYADPANGGNDDAASWSMLGWNPVPAGGWPALVSDPDAANPDAANPDAANPDEPTSELRAALIEPGQLRGHYDAIVIGSGAGGGTAACVLAESGRTVLVVERSSYPARDVLATDHLRNARTTSGFEDLTSPPGAQNPRSLLRGDGSVRQLTPTDGSWGNNAMTLGGGTRIYGAQAWRYSPEDFRMASTYGIPDGSDLADWPVSYEDMEPFYTRAEWEIGVSGAVAGDTSGAWRTRDYPMPPLPQTGPGRLLAAAADKINMNTLPVPLLINSQNRAGRNACALCGQCVGFSCPVEAKNGSHNTVLARAAATGRTAVLLETRAERVTTDSGGHVTGIALVGESSGKVWRRQITASEVIISAGAVESARLLLNSRSDQEPNGLGNNLDQVGRRVQGHVYAGALGIFADPVNDHVGPGPSIATNDYRHHNDGIVGGGMIANEFVPTPIAYRSYLRSAGLIPLHGPVAKERMRDLVPRMQRVVGPVQEVTSSEARVRLDPHLVDSFGIPVVQFSGSHHPEDDRTQAFLSERAAEWLSAAGATKIIRSGARPHDSGPSAGQHQAGSCRMGSDPAASVTDPYARVWGHDNLRVVDGSLHVTNGGVNPVLTIFANAFRVMTEMVGPT